MKILFEKCEYNGVPLPFIMQLLGHENMSTTSSFYAFATLEMMSDAMNKASPTQDNEGKLWKKADIKRLLYSKIRLKTMPKKKN